MHKQHRRIRAIILALSKLHALSVRRAIIKTDSQATSDYIEKSFKARDLELQKYLHTVRKIESFLLGIMTEPIPRSENSKADKVAKATAQGITLPLDVFYEVINQPLIELNIKAPKLINTIHSED